ncbi:MAG: hypothetical protein EOO27_00940 [Comamonadaceae bacterium]|nr:MAG: hypothetical protein EOO27_00940 [Comamonadaceae bacterium]
MNCFGLTSAPASEVERTTHLLAMAAQDAGMTVSVDGRVCERDAATLLAIAAGHLKALRQEGRGPLHYRSGVGGSRISYRVSVLADWIEAQRNDFRAAASNDRQRTGYVRVW